MPDTEFISLPIGFTKQEYPGRKKGKILCRKEILTFVAVRFKPFYLRGRQEANSYLIFFED